MSTTGRNKEEGFVLVTVACILVALLAFVALAVDVGVLYGARTSTQEVADAAALAGAFTFINNPTASQPDTASNHALQVALNNSILGTPVTAANVTVNVDVTNQTVTVDVASTQNTYFARVLGITTANVAAEGIGEAAKYSTGASCVKPWFIPNGIFGSGGICASCAANQVLISGGQVTAFAKSQFGQEFTLKSQDPHNSIAPGEFYAIQLPGSVGANDYSNNIATCATPYLRCGTPTPWKLGTWWDRPNRELTLSSAIRRPTLGSGSVITRLRTVFPISAKMSSWRRFGIPVQWRGFVPPESSLRELR